MATFTSLESTNVIGPGVERQLAKSTAHHSMFVFATEIPTQCVVTLEGSHDGVNWRSLGQCTFGATVSAGTTTNPNNFLVSYVRAVLVLLEGPEDIEVVATISSADDL